MKANLFQGLKELTGACLRNWRQAALLTLITGFTAPAVGQPIQLVSVLDPSQGPPAGGSGDSGTPIMSPDGRYVLFASTANNFVMITNDTPMPARFPAPLNVFLRDRTNGTTTLVSVNLSGTAGGNGDSLPMGLSTNGQYVVFESSASDLVAGDTNNATDVFVRDLVSGATLLVSVSINGLVGNGASRSPTMTPDGRYVAFVSAANNLVAGDNNGIPDVFVRDLQANVTTLVSVGARSASTSSLTGPEAPDISADGRFVAFYSSATNLVSGVPAGGDVYVRDLVAGNTIWASSGARAAVQASLGKANASSFNHMLSADGQFVAYEASASAATAGVILRYGLSSGSSDLIHTNAFVPWGAFENIHNLDMTPDGRFIAFVANTNGSSGINTCIQLWDATSGLSTLVSGDLDNQVPTNSVCDWPAVDDSGRFVAFLSNAGNLVSNSLTGEFHLYLRDTQTGGTRLLDADTNGVGSLVSPTAIPCLSAEGGSVVFECGDSGLVPNDSNRDSDLFVRDLADDHVELISARHPDLPSLSPNGPSTLGPTPVSTDGRFIAFVSSADNLVPNDTNGCPDIFVRDMLYGTNLLVSAATNGGSADFSSTDPVISGNGRFVAFTSSADNLVVGDTNKAQDVFVRDLQSGTTVLVSVNSAGSGPGNGASYSPAISSDGRYVLFRSRALNLASGSFTAGYENLFVLDLQVGTNYALTHSTSTSGSPVGSMTPDGRFVAFVGIFAGSAAKLYVWDSQLAGLVYTNAGGTILKLAVSPDGNRIAYTASTTLYAVDRAANTSRTIGQVASGSGSKLRFSGDGRFLVYVAPQSSTNQVYLYDFQTPTNTLVSGNYGAGGAAYGSSDSPDISADGRFVAYHSAAANIVQGDTNGLPDLFLYDRLAGATTLLSTSRFGNTSADNRSLTPVFSGDGQTLVLQSCGSDLVAQDFNHFSDVFAISLPLSGETPLFQVAALAGTPPGRGCWFTWPILQGRSYRVQFKDSLSDANWQDFNGGTTLIGGQGYFNDPAPAAPRRFYRIVAF
jgi:Tol biopolymer transport system component